MSCKKHKKHNDSKVSMTENKNAAARFPRVDLSAPKEVNLPIIRFVQLKFTTMHNEMTFPFSPFTQECLSGLGIFHCGQ